MKKVLIVLFFVALCIGQDLDSREGDSLALEAIMNANPGSYINYWTDQGCKCKWGGPLDKWSRVLLNEHGRVEELSLYYLNLASIPPEIGNLKSLKMLDLYQNNLRSLPEEISNLTNLTSINLGMNYLTSLPAGIGGLSSLEHLNASDNNFKNESAGLKTLPAEIGALKNITYLDLHGNQLENLPIEIIQLKPTSGLKLSGNKKLKPETIDSKIVTWVNIYDSIWRGTITNLASRTTANYTPLTVTLFSNTLHFSRNLTAGSFISIYDLLGRKIVYESVKGSNFAIPDLAGGMYIAEIFSENRSMIQKISIR